MKSNNDHDPLDNDELLATVDPMESFDPDLTTDQPSSRTPMDGLEQTIDSAGTPASGLSKRESLSCDGLDDRARAEVDRVCRAFDQAWQEDGDAPSVASFLPDDPRLGPDVRQILVRQLVSMDLKHRRQRDRSLPKSEYLKQLPGCIAGIESAFVEIEEATIRGSTQIWDSGEPSARVISHRAHDPNARYQPTEMHARGGLGAVFRALDQELKREVALKEILPEHSAKPHYQEKFVFEAEITGSLEHPGIVPVYGLGRYSDQQPYYAMRFIRGLSFSDAIKAFHKSNAKPSKDSYLEREFRLLLRRLIDACNAIHFAHEHGVLHRDIKPANIMLGPYGETLVVDWGLAKLMDASLETLRPRQTVALRKSEDGGSGGTRRGAIVGTPMYMSPEQAQGDQDTLDGRSDVYSLGAVLFFLITGATPIEGKTSIDVIQNVRSGKVRRVDRINPAAPRPLASICAKAMSLAPSERYQKATDLADDIDRWMNDELVLAHAKQENVVERAGRLLRRHRGWTISGASALVVIAVVALAATVLVNRARNNERLAKIQAQEYKADALSRYRDSRQAIDTWLVQSSDALQFFPGAQSVRKRLLEQAVKDYERLSQNESSDPELELERGRALVRVGDLDLLRQDFDNALKHYEAARTVFENTPDDSSLANVFRAEAAGSQIRTGAALAEQGAVQDAESAYQDSIEALSKLDGASNDHTKRLLANAHVNAGQLYVDSAPQKALDHLSDALSTYESIQDQSDAQVQLGAGSARNLLGQIHRDLGDHEKALQYFGQSTNSLTQLVQQHPDHPEYLDSLASTLVSQAASYRTLGRDEEMFATLQTAVDHFRAIRVSLPGIPRYEENLAVALTDLALSQHGEGLDDLAAETSEEADTLLAELVQTYGQSPQILESYSVCQDARGQVLLDLEGDAGDTFQIAESVLLQLIQTSESDEQIKHLFERLAITQSHLAGALGRAGQTEQASTLFDEAVNRLESLIEIQGQLPRLRNALAHTHYQHGLVLEAAGLESAESEFNSAAELWMNHGDRPVASYCDSAAWLLCFCPIETARDFVAARDLALHAVSLAPDKPRYRCTLALALTLNGELPRAMSEIQRVKTLEREPGDYCGFIRAIVEHANENETEARASYEKAETWRQTHRPFNPELMRLRRFTMEKVGSETRP